MTPLWIGIVALLVLFALFVCAPLRLAPRLAASQGRFEREDGLGAANVRVFRSRLAALDALRGEGGIDQADYVSARLELERKLLEESGVAQPAALASVESGRWLVLVGLLAAAGASLAAYHFAGSAGDLALYGVRQEVAASNDPSSAHYIARFEQEAERQPGNPNAWGLLYPLYRDAGRFDDAVRVLERVIALEGETPALLAELAQAKYFSAGRRMTPEVQRLAELVERLDQRQPTLHGMLGFDAFTRGEFQQAIDHWRLALAGQQDPASTRALREGIEIARQRLAASPAGGTGDSLPSTRQ